MVYVVMPYPEEASPSAGIESYKTGDGSSRVQVRLPNGILDEIILGESVRVTRTLPDGQSSVWATLDIKP